MRGSISRPARRVFPAWLGILAAAVVVGCEGGTILEGEPLHVPPDVTIDRTATKSRVHAGTSFRILARAVENEAGVASMDVVVEGAVEHQFRRSFPDAPAVAVLDTSLTVPRSATGEIRVAVTALSANGMRSEPVRASIAIIEADTIPPLVAVESMAPDRAEADDSITVAVRCQDPGEDGQLAWCGYLVRFVGPAGDTITVTRRDTVMGVDTASIQDVLPLAGFDVMDLPSELSIEVHGHAVDAAGNCAAGMTSTPSSGICLGGGDTVQAAFPDVDPTRLTVVASRTIHRGWGGTLEDLAVDPKRGVVYGSVIDENVIEVLDYLAEPVDARLGRVAVGSQPAGITVDRTGDTLIVANSGGTSLSFVDLRQRVERSRMETHNAVLYTIDETVGTGEQGDTTLIEALTFWTDYGDRPHQVAQDRDGIIFYSTLGGGPIRMVETYPSYQTREANIMLWSDVLVKAEGSWAVTYVDSMVIEPESIYAGGQTLVVYDHVAGRPDQHISARGGIAQIEEILASLKAQGSDVFYRRNVGWDIDFWNVGAEAVFATSADRSTVAIGDGDRVWTWQASGAHPGYDNRIISWYLSIGDLTTNGASGLTGLAVDRTGAQFAAKGAGSVLYFNDLLRLHGSHTRPELAGEGGLARHPTEPWAFVATNDRSVLILETMGNYRVLAELPLVENLVGPLRLSMPRAGDPASLLVRLHGISESGDVVTLPVWQGALQ